MSKGLVLSERAYLGSVTPPDAFEDESRFGNDGVHTNITWVKNPQGLWVRNLNGVNAFVEFSSLQAFNSLAGAVAFWFNPDVDTDQDRGTMLLGRNAGGNQAGDLGIIASETTTSNKMDFFIQDGAATATALSDAVNFVAGTWVFVVGTWVKDGLQILYINGIAQATTDTGLELKAHATLPLQLGADGNDGANFDGKIALLRICNYALSAEQIAAIFQSERHWFGV